jgi:predicted ArsR family transcriptional regulator
MSDSNAYRERYAAITFLLIKSPRTVSELSELTGHSHEGVRGWLRALHAEGLLEAQEAPAGRKGGAKATVYRWNPELSAS